MNAEAEELPVTVAQHGAVTLITLNRPKRRNALTPEMLCRLADAVVEFDQSAEQRVAVITGAGTDAFCAGGDLERTIPLMTGARAAEDEWDQRVLDDPLVMAASGLRDYPLDKPVIAALSGSCMAAGFELMLGTDLRVAGENARFALPEVSRGVVPFAGSMVRLARQIPWSVAMEIMMVGAPISAVRAEAVGLINRVVPTADVLAVAMELAQSIAANAPLAIQAVKRTARETSGLPLDEAYRIENREKALVLASDDAREGPAAFMQKRPARFRGA